MCSSYEFLFDSKEFFDQYFKLSELKKVLFFDKRVSNDFKHDLLKFFFSVRYSLEKKENILIKILLKYDEYLFAFELLFFIILIILYSKQLLSIL